MSTLQKRQFVAPVAKENPAATKDIPHTSNSRRPQRYGERSPKHVVKNVTISYMEWDKRKEYCTFTVIANQ